MEREHVVVLAREKLVADPRDHLVRRSIQSPAGSIGSGGTLLQDGVRRNHLRRYELPADAEMLKRALRLRSPKLVDRHFHWAEAVVLDARGIHRPPGAAVRGRRGVVERTFCRTSVLPAV